MTTTVLISLEPPLSVFCRKCCHCPDNVTAVLDAAAEGPVAKEDEPGVALRVLGGTPVVAGGDCAYYLVLN